MCIAAASLRSFFAQKLTIVCKGGGKKDFKFQETTIKDLDKLGEGGGAVLLGTR